jgi:hypothetical protein
MLGGGGPAEAAGGGTSSSSSDSAERGRGAEGGGRMEGSSDSREGSTGSSGGGRTAALAHNGAFRSQTHHPGFFQHRAYSIRVVYSVKGEEESDRGAVHVSVRLIVLFFVHC